MAAQTRRCDGPYEGDCLNRAAFPMAFEMAETVPRFFRRLGKERTERVKFLCSDPWRAGSRWSGAAGDEKCVDLVRADDRLTREADGGRGRDVIREIPSEWKGVA